jgi:hypothetical protein
MPGKERVRPAITREMRLVSRLIETSPEVSDTSLAQFIARRRNPESGPHSWNEISHALTPVIDEIVTEGTLRKWASPSRRIREDVNGQPPLSSARENVGVRLAWSRPVGRIRDAQLNRWSLTHGTTCRRPPRA